MKVPWWTFSLILFVSVLAITSLVFRDFSVALVVALAVAVAVQAIATGKLNVGRFGIVRIVGRDSAWYWVMLVLIGLVVLAFAIGAPKRDLAGFFS